MRDEAVRTRRERHLARHPRAVEHERVGGQLGRSRRANVLQVLVEEVLNARVGRAEAVAQQLVFLVVIAQQRAGDLKESGIGRGAARRLPKGYEFQVDVSDEFVAAPGCHVHFYHGGRGARGPGCAPVLRYNEAYAKGVCGRRALTFLT